MSLPAIPSWSTVVTRHGVLFAPLTAVPGRIYGWAAYIHTPVGRDPDVEFWGAAWTKVLGLPYDEYRPLVSHIPGLADDRLGRLASIDPRAITYALSPQEPELVARYRDNRRALAAHRPYRKTNGRLDHLRFRIPGIEEWFDPRFSVLDPITPTLVSGDYEPLGVRPACTVIVTEDRAGLFNPARYRLDDGTMLVSYRLGHAALFRVGDRLALPALPCARFGQQVVRLLLRYEHIDIVS